MSYNSVLVKTPLRVSFFGGGTDFKYFYSKNECCLISSAINKFIYVIVKRGSNFYPDKFRVNYSTVEKVNNINSVSNNIVRETLKYFKIKDNLNITIINDIPAGSGLGSSSSFCLGLVLAINKLFELKIKKNDLLKIAINIEINKIKSPIGIQDYLPAFNGNLNFYKFRNANIIRKTKIKDEFAKKLFNSICLVWTGSFRDANSILKDQSNKENKNTKELKSILQLSKEVYNKINTNSIDIKSFGQYIKETWILKKKLSKKIYNKKLIKFEKKFDSISGIYGYKLLGAGGEGFFLIISNKKGLVKLRNFYKSSILSIDKYDYPAHSYYLNK